MTATVSEARRRLEAVDALLLAAEAATTAARASVWLLRLAIEYALDDLWAARAPEVAGASTRVQLLVLTRYVDAEDAWRTTELWNVLSRAAHHHAYELTWTRAEVLTWRRDVEIAVTALERGVRR